MNLLAMDTESVREACIPYSEDLRRRATFGQSSSENGKSLRRVYRATPRGRKALAGAKKKIHELFREVVGGP
jgi:PadR family transcriptional regulator, regulatory protein PadR